MTKWLDVAHKYEGEGERPGKAVNPIVLGWINANGRPDWKDDSTIAWCGFFQAGVFTEAGLAGVIPKEPGAAASWRTVGVALTEPRVGAIVVMPRLDPKNPSAAHVALIVDFNAESLKVIGGNQGKEGVVSVATYKRDDLAYTYRWPLKEASPAELAAGGSRIAAAAQRQKRDAAVSTTASGSTQLPAIDVPPAPPTPSGGGLRTVIDDALGGASWLKTTATKMLDFATFAGVHWRWVALGVAAYFALRFLYDAHVIGRARAEDHNQGYSLPKGSTPEASP